MTKEKLANLIKSLTNVNKIYLYNVDNETKKPIDKLGVNVIDGVLNFYIPAKTDGYNIIDSSNFKEKLEDITQFSLNELKLKLTVSKELHYKVFDIKYTDNSEIIIEFGKVLVEENNTSEPVLVEDENKREIKYFDATISVYKYKNTIAKKVAEFSIISNENTLKNFSEGYFITDVKSEPKVAKIATDRAKKSLIIVSMNSIDSTIQNDIKIALKSFINDEYFFVIK